MKYSILQALAIIGGMSLLYTSVREDEPFIWMGLVVLTAVLEVRRGAHLGKVNQKTLILGFVSLCLLSGTQSVLEIDAMGWGLSPLLLYLRRKVGWVVFCVATGYALGQMLDSPFLHSPGSTVMTSLLSLLGGGFGWIVSLWDQENDG